MPFGNAPSVSAKTKSPSESFTWAFFWLEICCLPNAFHVDAMCASSSQCCCSSGVKKQPVTSIRVWCGAARKIRMAAMSKLGTNAWQLPTGDQHSLPVASCRMRALVWCVKSDTGSTLAMYGEYQTSLKSNFQKSTFIQWNSVCQTSLFNRPIFRFNQ